MVHDLKLYDENFERIKTGFKIREYRLYDEKRRKIKVGDTLRFIKLPEADQYLYVDVIGVEVFKNWYDCYQKYFDEDFKERYHTVSDVVDDTYNGYYSLEDSNKYGCCCLTFTNCRNQL